MEGVVMKTINLTWALAAIRRSRGRIVCSETISPELRLIIIHRWLEAGGTHHETVVYGEHRARIRLLAKMLGVEYLEL